MDFATGQFPQGPGPHRRSRQAIILRLATSFSPARDRTVFEELKAIGRSWRYALAAALSLGIYSVKLAVAYRADHPALPGNDYGKSGR